MFYRKQIKDLEKRVSDLEAKVKTLTFRVREQGNDIDELLERFNKLEADRKPKYRPRKKNGKETPAAE